MNTDTVRLDLEATSKEQILSQLVEVLVETGVIREGAALLETLLEREGLGSTGIGYGVAIPHGRCEEVSRPAVIFARTRNEVEFDSIDGRPTRIFFLLVAPKHGGNEHLHLLARIARLMKDGKTREKLLELESPEEVVALLAAEESA